jgi:MFS_1 like family
VARFFTSPSPKDRNWAVVQADSVFLGIVSAAGTFLPVFLVRLGASGSEIGLLTAIPALTAFTLAIPFGRWLQARRNIVPWYSRLRLAGWCSYAAMAVVAAVLPPGQAVRAMLVVWAVASLPSTAGLVAFPIVMDGAAGPDGRFDLLGRRWAIAGTSTTISVAIGGQLLSILPFPLNFELLFGAVTLAGVASYWVSRQIVIDDQAPAQGDGTSIGQRLRALGSLVTARRGFMGYELRALVYAAGIGIAVPLLPLFYVHEVGASNAWIGIIGAAQSAGGVLGYLSGRRISLRRTGANILLPSLLGVAAVPATLSVLHWLPGVAIVAFVSGLAAAGAQLAMFDRLMRSIPREHGVTFSSVDQSLQNLGLIVAPNVGGLLAASVGVRPGLVVASAIIAAAMILFSLDAGLRLTVSKTWSRLRGATRPRPRKAAEPG